MLLSEILRVTFGLVAVIGLIGICAVIARKAGLLSASGGLVRKRRLAVVETLALDARRRLAIIKCDSQEHLIVLGANGEQVIASNLEPTPSLETPQVEIDAGKDQRDNPFAIMRALRKFRDEARSDAVKGDLEKADAA
ncbi:MAG: FliO/MopB family protein [Marinicaulis sp.]|nr:FliO/MopB family protein [Marinicaulis sp.]